MWRETWHIVGPEVEQVLATGKSVVREGALVALERNGQIQDLYWNYSYSPVYEAGSINGVLLRCQEVTENLLATRKLQASEAHLTALAGGLSQVMEATTDAIVSVNRRWEITYLNPQALRTYAADRELVGKRLWEEFPDALYEGSPYVQHYEQAMYRQQSGAFEAFYPAPLNRWLRVSVFPTRDGIVTFSRDITEERRTAAALIQSEKLAAVGRLASSIAHEINNPLEAVTNLLYIARQHGDAAAIHALLDTADEELRRVTAIASQTLAFHRQSTRPRKITCIDLFGSVLVMYQAKLRNAGIEVHKRKRANEPVLIFEGDIRQVLNNVVGNAIDAMPTGGRLTLRSREYTHPRTGIPGLLLTIADTGQGIAQRHRARIFDAFYTTKGIGGTGLGLWISADIMQRHGGGIRLRSSQLQGRCGTVVTLFLPLEYPSSVSLDQAPDA